MRREIALGIGHAAAARHDGDPGGSCALDDFGSLVGAARQSDGERLDAGLPEDIVGVEGAARVVGEHRIVAQRSAQGSNEAIAATHRLTCRGHRDHAASKAGSKR